MATLQQRRARRRVYRYLSRCDPSKAVAVVRGEVEFADGTRNIRVFYDRGRVVVGRPGLKRYEQLFELLRRAIMEVRLGAPLKTVEDRLLTGALDLPAEVY